MGKKKLMLSEEHRKILISSAYKTYLAEMYLLQKSTESKDILCDKCENVLKRPLKGVFSDYQTQNSINIMSAVVEIVEPVFWNNNIKGKDTVNMVEQVVIYLTGVNMFNQKEVDKITVGESDVKDAISITDLTDKSKIRIAKTIPKK